MTARSVLHICLFSTMTAAPGEAQLRGEPEAIAAAERLLEAVGGADTWANGRTIYIQLRGHLARETEVWNETYWIDLVEPRGRYEIRSGGETRIIAWTADGGWERRSDVVEPYDDDRLAFEYSYWMREPKVVLRRLAAASPATRVALDSTDANLARLTIYDLETGDELCWFALDVEGRPVKWSTTLGEMQLEHVFGPLTDYDGARLPAWGATIGGVWRYEHITAALTGDPPPVSFARPAVP